VRGEDVSPPALWTAMMTDHDFFVPAMRFAALQSHHAPVYGYLFTYPSPVMGGVFGSIHGLELPFLWGFGNEPGLATLVGDAEAVAPLSAAIQDAWLAFARTGDPSSDGIGIWPAYDVARRATMILDLEPMIMNAPREAERQFWERVRSG
jgi:para-nitrobenzyl esterase